MTLQNKARSERASENSTPKNGTRNMPTDKRPRYQTLFEEFTQLHHGIQVSIQDCPPQPGEGEQYLQLTIMISSPCELNCMHEVIQPLVNFSRKRFPHSHELFLPNISFYTCNIIYPKDLSRTVSHEISKMELNLAPQVYGYRPKITSAAGGAFGTTVAPMMQQNYFQKVDIPFKANQGLFYES